VVVELGGQAAGEGKVLLQPLRCSARAALGLNLRFTQVHSRQLAIGPEAESNPTDLDTLAGALVGSFEKSVLVQGDTFFAFLASGRLEPWLSGSHEQNTVVTRAAAAAAGHFPQIGYATLYDGVVGPWLLPAFAEAAGLDSLDYLILLPSVERCVLRVVQRVGHDFRAEDATQKMHAEFAGAKIDHRHILLDPPGSFARVVAWVQSATKQGALRYKASGAGGPSRPGG